MNNIATKKHDPKKISKMCRLFEELYSDRTPYITEAYIEKAEELLKVVFDIFVKPDFEQLCPVYPKFDRDDETFMYKQTHELSFGYTTSNGHVVVNSGTLYIAQTRLTPDPFKYYHDKVDNENCDRKDWQKQCKSFFELRNNILGDLIATVAHEYRHLMQKIYLELLQSPKSNKTLLHMIKNKLGPCTQELEQIGLAGIFSGSSAAWMKYEAIADFGIDNDLVSQDQYHLFAEEILRPDTCYELKAHEKDARNFEAKVMFEISKHLRNYHRLVKQMQEKALFKQDELNQKFYKLSNARIDFYNTTDMAISKEIKTRQKSSLITKYEKTIAANITVDSLRKAAKQHLHEYENVNNADMSFCYVLDILLKNKHFDNFFKTANLQSLCQELKELGLHISAHRLEEKIADLDDEQDLN